VVRHTVDASGEEKHELEFVVEFQGIAAVFGGERFLKRGNSGAGSIGEAVCHVDAEKEEPVGMPISLLLGQR
jgi:hypothetical protein